MIPALRRYLIAPIFCLSLLPAYAVARVFMPEWVSHLLEHVWEGVMRDDGRRDA
jgi:hypothetical protein